MFIRHLFSLPRLCSASALALALAVGGSSAHAATITWTLEAIDGTTPDTIVRNDDTFKAALNMDATSSATVNSVVFTAGGSGDLTPSVTTNGVTIAVTSGVAGTLDGDFGNIYSPSLSDVMDRAFYTDQGDGINTTISGLTIGRDYRVQFLMDESTVGGRVMHMVNGTAGAGVNDSSTFTVGDSGHGESVLAEFEADATSISIVIQGNSGYRALLSGMTVFEEVPEPMSGLLFGIGLVGLALGRRRRGR